MAKTPKVKKREVSIHSRAARRGSEPAPTKDLSVKASKVSEETDFKPWLHSAQNAGITKKTKSKTQTHAQRMRQQKALEKGNEIADRLEKKLGDSKKRSRKVQARRADWEELNGQLTGAKEKKKKKVGAEANDAKPMEGVVPNLEKSLLIRSAEASAAGNMPVEEQVQETAEAEEDEVL